MSALFSPENVVPAPKGAGFTLGIAVPLEIASALFAVAVAVLVVPLADLAPVVGLATALTARRWEGASVRLFSWVAIVSAVMLAQWVVWWAALLAGGIDGGSGVLGAVMQALTGLAFTTYPVQLVVLFVLTGVASVVSIRSIRRTREVVVPGTVA